MTSTSEIRVQLVTASGTGTRHKVRLSAENIIPKEKIEDFQLKQHFIFSDIYEGDKYTIDIEAFSEGSDPLIRNYQYTLIAFPAKPIQILLSLAEDSLRMGFESYGLRHEWYITLVLSPIFRLKVKITSNHILAHLQLRYICYIIYQ